MRLARPVPWNKWGPYLSERQWAQFAKTTARTATRRTTLVMTRAVPAPIAGEKTGLPAFLMTNSNCVSQSPSGTVAYILFYEYFMATTEPDWEPVTRPDGPGSSLAFWICSLVGTRRIRSKLRKGDLAARMTREQVARSRSVRNSAAMHLRLTPALTTYCLPIKALMRQKVENPGGG